MAEAARSDPCDVCGKTFASPMRLSKHRYVHCSVRHFKCQVCFKAYKQYSSLCRHTLMNPSCKQVRCWYSPCGQGVCDTATSPHYTPQQINVVEPEIRAPSPHHEPVVMSTFSEPKSEPEINVVDVEPEIRAPLPHYTPQPQGLIPNYPKPTIFSPRHPARAFSSSSFMNEPVVMTSFSEPQSEPKINVVDVVPEIWSPLPHYTPQPQGLILIPYYPQPAIFSPGHPARALSRSSLMNEPVIMSTFSEPESEPEINVVD